MPRGHKQKKLITILFIFFCLCPIDLGIKLNFIIAKVAYWKQFIKLGLNYLRQ